MARFSRIDELGYLWCLYSKAIVHLVSQPAIISYKGYLNVHAMYSEFFCLPSI